MAIEALKIGLVLDDSLDKTDGVQQYVLAIGKWLSEQGHEVHYLVGETKRTDIPRVHSLSRNVAVRFNGNRLSMPLPGSKKAIRTLVGQESFDILHVQVPYSPFMAGRVIKACQADAALIGTFHILPHSKLAALGSKLLAIWLRPTLRRFDNMLSVSTAAARFARQTYSIESQVLPNVIDYEKFHKASALSTYSNNTKIVLFLGRLVPRKGCGLLLEAVNELVHSGEALPDFRVVICGRGPLEASLKRFVAEHGLADQVEFTGFVSETDKPHYYAAADIAVFPSNGGESFGIVLLEAMASGQAAILAGDNPGYASVMEPQSDLLFNPTSATGLAHKLRWLLGDDTARQIYAAWGAAYAEQFDTVTVGWQLIDIYKTALRSRRNVR